MEKQHSIYLNSAKVENSQKLVAVFPLAPGKYGDGEELRYVFPIVSPARGLMVAELADFKFPNVDEGWLMCG
ncbi:hypothetical protein [Paenibacillus sp. FSL R7-0179]|uniref:hypothetical protein n=1 Tax=Paenibacillus sp. FSL R7-0179 TaxID=2921672 RepID=UPI0030F5CFE8